MLSLVELGSNYLPLIYFVPKMRFVLLLGEIRGFLQKGGPLEAVSRKIENRTKSRRSDGNKAEHRTAEHQAQWPGPHTARRTTVSLAVRWSCVLARSCQGPRAVSCFLGLFNAVLLHFWRDLSDFF